MRLGVVTLLAVIITTVLVFPVGRAAELPAVMVLNIKHEEQASPGLATILTELA